MNRKQINSIEVNGAEPLAAANPGNATGGQEFHVTFYNSQHGRVSIEIFDNAASAQRFADRMICDEDDWAIVDPVPRQQNRIAA
ncbi:hypothetical protein ACW0JT_24845 [Arthrobacter sp. SA17]